MRRPDLAPEALAFCAGLDPSLHTRPPTSLRMTLILVISTLALPGGIGHQLDAAGARCRRGGVAVMLSIPLVAIEVAVGGFEEVPGGGKGPREGEGGGDAHAEGRFAS